MKELGQMSWLVRTIVLMSIAAGPSQRVHAELPSFSVERMVAHRGFDGETCWVHARAGAIPPHHKNNESDQPLVVMTMQKLLLTGSDVFFGLNETRSSDGGASWTAPAPQDVFKRQQFRSRDLGTIPAESIADNMLRDGDVTTVCDFVPAWHAPSQRLLGIGQTVWYRDNRVMSPRPRGIAYAVYDAAQNKWEPWKTVELPPLDRFQDAGSGSVQRVDLPGGDVLLPFYFKEPSSKRYSTAVCRCRFDGQTLWYLEHGTEMSVTESRGLYEPSLTQFRGRYYITMRNDECGYVSVSDDGITFSEPKKWLFNDGEDLGNYNTQQHWVTHRDGLFLVYTRRGANNDHVFRHRAPLFIASVDPATLRVIRSTEQVLVPERGARLGNFGVVDVSSSETWITAAEWMQPQGVEKYGSDNSVHIAKLKWTRPNVNSEATGHDSPRAPAWTDIQSYFAPPQAYRDDVSGYATPLQFTDGTRVETAEDWQRRREEIRTDWENLLGKWPALDQEPQVELLASEQKEGFTQERIRFRWTPTESTTGYVLVPNSTGPHPAVITVYYEPETAIGVGKSDRDFALQLVRRGFVVLSLGTTEASEAKTYAIYHPTIDDARVAPLSMLGFAAAQAWYVLASRPDVDSKRIGIVGHSFGGKWAMFAACLFDKFACAAWSDPGIVFNETRPSVNYWEPWYLGYHAPPWRERGLITAENPAKGLYPSLIAAGHDLHELHALMAPRPFLVSGGSEDPISQWRALNHTVAVNRILGYEHRVAMTNRPDHDPNPDSNHVLYAFFEHFLKPAATE
jgi:dienelactone hydrolase